MTTPTYDLLSSTVLTSTATSVTISSLPTLDANGNTYKDLILTSQCGTTSSQLQYLGIRLNSDSSGNRLQTFFANYNNSLAANTFGGVTTNWDNASQVRNDLHSFCTFQIFDYTSTNKQKTILFRSSKADYAEALGGARVDATQAVNSVTFSADGFPFLVGSTFRAYGIAG